jgi:hypothetical protein
MSIHFISGKPGGGKTLYSVKLILEELIHGTRCIVTNVPLKIQELNSYLQREYPFAFQRRFIDPGLHISEVVILIDEDDLSKFFTFRGGGVRLESVSNAEWKCGKRPDYTSVKDGGVFYALDEVHIAFNSRAWADTGAEVLYYLSQHRKLGDDVVCITQSVGNVDKQFRSVAQDYTYIKNLAKQKVGLFRLPSIFTRNTYPQPATDTSKPMESGTFSLDVTGLASLYDTARGVGIHGRGGADTNARKKGLHWAWVIVGLVALGVLLKYLPTILTHAFSHHAPMHQHQPAATNAPAAAPALPTFQPKPSPAPNRNDSSETKVADTSPAVDDVYCCGFSLLGGQPVAIMSDGTQIGQEDGLQKLAKKYIVVAGRKIPIHAKPEPEYIPHDPVIWPQPPASPPRPVNDVEILPAIHSRFDAEPPKLNGFEKMQRSTAANMGNFPMSP